MESKKELLNKGFSVRADAVIPWAGTAAKKLLLTFKSGPGQHGQLLLTAQPLKAPRIGGEDSEIKKSSYKRIRHSVLSKTHKCFSERVEPHLSDGLHSDSSRLRTKGCGEKTAAEHSASLRGNRELLWTEG